MADQYVTVPVEPTPTAAEDHTQRLAAVAAAVDTTRQLVITNDDGIKVDIRAARMVPLLLERIDTLTQVVGDLTKVVDLYGTTLSDAVHYAHDLEPAAGIGHIADLLAEIGEPPESSGLSEEALAAALEFEWPTGAPDYAAERGQG